MLFAQFYSVIRPFIEYSKIRTFITKGEFGNMIDLSLGHISITNIRDSSGFFIGKKNTHKAIWSESVINEVIGELSGNENLVTRNNWVINKHKGKDE
ncbi:MAG: hypothetical protein Q8935_03390 [Bacillota bacterium]|nr:hypothetical protein [Bacillota bacterium]